MRNGRILWIEYVRAIACVLVIVLHVSSPYFQWNLKSYISGENNTYWYVGNVFDSISRMCVPLFFMISGYFFYYEKKPKMSNNIKIIKYLLSYSFLYYIFYNSINYFMPEYFYLPKIGFLEYPASYHLWFFYSLIIIYIFSYFISMINTNGKFILLSILFIVFILNSKSTFITESLFSFKMKYFFSINDNIIFFVIYASFGAITRKVSKDKHHLILPFSLALLLISISTIINLTEKESVYRGYNYVEFYAYSSPLVFLSSASFFLLMLSLSSKLRDNIFINIVSSNSLTIYGVHAGILFIILETTKYHVKYNPIITIPVVTFIVLFLSIFISILLRKIDRFKLLT
ncbi:acyltransferase family protein [Proteus sp. G2673]|uniref:acyltransferase n=1 Tax=Proteus sp. G2673 TaxID=2698885 RepID=UPI0013765E45|nr:acyltransferase family protein [Proteus sp. G2673]